MNPTEFSQWLATNPPLADIRAIAKLAEEARYNREAADRIVERYTPYTGWGTEAQRYQLFTICQSLKEVGYRITYDLTSATDELQIWTLQRGSTIGTLVWERTPDKFSVSTNLPFHIHHDGTVVAN